MTRVCVAIETAGSHLGLGLYDVSGGDAKRLALSFEPEQGRQSDRIIPLLQSLLKASRLTKRDIGLIAVDYGPGSFTGVRVGVSVARALAQGLDKPIVGVCGLEALAREDHFGNGARVAACLPALPGDVYFAIFKAGSWDSIVAPSWGTEQKFLDALAGFRDGEVINVVGMVAPSLAPKLAGLTNVNLAARGRAAHPDWIASAAIQRFDPKAPRARTRFDSVIPLYLQPSWAERTQRGA